MGKKTLLAGALVISLFITTLPLSPAMGQPSVTEDVYAPIVSVTEDVYAPVVPEPAPIVPEPVLEPVTPVLLDGLISVFPVLENKTAQAIEILEGGKHFVLPAFTTLAPGNSAELTRAPEQNFHKKPGEGVQAVLTTANVTQQLLVQIQNVPNTLVIELYVVGKLVGRVENGLIVFAEQFSLQGDQVIDIKFSGFGVMNGTEILFGEVVKMSCQ